MDGAAIVQWLADKNKFNQKTVSGGVGEQDTISDGGDTLTVDFQGSRLSSSGLNVWLDVQVQKGGGGSGRNSYAQVMIVSDIKVDKRVLAAAIDEAFKLSRKHGCRILIAPDSAFDMPN